MTRRKFSLFVIATVFIANCDRGKTQRTLDKQLNANERNGIDPGHGNGEGMGNGGGPSK